MHLHTHVHTGGFACDHYVVNNALLVASTSPDHYSEAQAALFMRLVDSDRLCNSKRLSVVV